MKREVFGVIDGVITLYVIMDFAILFVKTSYTALRKCIIVTSRNGCLAGLLERHLRRYGITPERLLCFFGIGFDMFILMNGLFGWCLILSSECGIIHSNEQRRDRSVRCRKARYA